MPAIRECVAAVTLAAGLFSANPAGACAITVFWDANFQGPSRQIESDVFFVGQRWNDQISSIVVDSGVWEFYEDWHYEGARFRLGPGEYSFVGQRWNDRISSMRCVQETE